MRRDWWPFALAAVVLLGLVLRLRGIHDPILDHPGWRQGDTAAIARNFATLDLDPFHPQTDYDGPPPNYVELELQIVPFLAALLYKIFGIHEIFGRLISIAFSLGTVVVCGAFARRLFGSRLAGISAALAFAIYPGSTYYGRTFMPDTTMAFFLCAAIYAAERWIDEEPGGTRFDGRFWLAALLAATAVLAKPVAAVELVPIAALFAARRGLAGALRAPQAYAFAALAILPYAAYDAYIRSIAEWHWASGITRLHVLPSLAGSFASFPAFVAKLAAFEHALKMLATTMLGPVGFAAFAVAIVVPAPSRSRTVLFAWLGAALAYAYVVVTVERVDYYLYPFVPLAAIWTGGLAEAVRRMLPAGTPRRVALGAGALVALVTVILARREMTPYYAYGKAVYRQAKALDATLPPGALVVMGHYDPSVLYYIDRKGWEEDPYLWTPFDEESAIRKGARAFIAIEPRRLARNVELSAWLLRFPLANQNATWPVYITDPGKIVPGAEARWRTFRAREKAGSLPLRG
jgi:4-amino-4-deoxy-L-arabinose transferase-like glycosyltransferase